jgi:hypothetical protein
MSVLDPSKTAVWSRPAEGTPSALMGFQEPVTALPVGGDSVSVEEQPPSPASATTERSAGQARSARELKIQCFMLPLPAEQARSYHGLASPQL